MNTKELFRRLREPFPRSAVKWRVGAISADRKLGEALPYIDARDVQNRLDDVLGPENWQTELTAQGSSVFVCKLSLRVNGEWLSKSDGAQIDDYRPGFARTNAKELAFKGAMSDALKRAAVQWGIGRYLYEFDPPLVPLDERLRLTQIPELPSHMLPESERAAAHAAAARSAKPRAAARERTAPNDVPALPPPVDATVPQAATGETATAVATAQAEGMPSQQAAHTAAGSAVAPVSMAPLESLPEEIRAAELTDEQLTRVRFILQKIRAGKTSTTVLANFIRGERNTDLPQAVREKMIELVEQS
jgi:hypothetical protein